MNLNLRSISLQKELSNIDLSSNGQLRQLNLAISLCTGVLTEFKKEITVNDFSDIPSEINFFKHIKQVPLKNLIYYSEIRSFEIQFPKAIKTTQQDFVLNKMRKLNRFFGHNIDFAHYIESSQEHMDEKYFTRSQYPISTITHSKFYYLEPDFNTSHDMLLAKLLAYHSLIGYLQERLQNLEDPNTILDKHISKNKLHWTSSKAGMTELVYALYHSGAVNNGNAEIKEIANALQRTFNFDLGDFYRTYTEIRARKKSRVKFLDELSSRLISRLDMEDD
jgi:hypothetical protein